MKAPGGRRLLQVTTIPETLEAFLLPFAEHFRAQGWVVEAAANGVSENDACLSAFDAVHDVPWTRSPFSPANLRAGRKVREVVIEGNFDIVHVHTPIASFVSRLALMRLRPKPVVVYTAHGFHFHKDGNPFSNQIYSLLERLAALRTDWLVVINSEDEAAAKRLRLAPEGRLTLLPGIGVDITGFKERTSDPPEPTTLLASLGLPNDAIPFLMAAEFTPNKRQVDAVRALAKIAENLPNIHLLLAGEGPMRARVEELAHVLGVGARVHFLGYRRDVPALLKASKALMLLSEREGLPRSALEAMAVGVPVIGTRIRGIVDLLAGGAGYLVPVGDIGEIAAAMNRVLSAPDEAERVEARAGQRVQSSDVSVILQRYDEVYETVLAGLDS